MNNQKNYCGTIRMENPFNINNSSEVNDEIHSRKSFEDFEEAQIQNERKHSFYLSDMESFHDLEKILNHPKINFQSDVFKNELNKNPKYSSEDDDRTSILSFQKDQQIFDNNNNINEIDNNENEFKTVSKNEGNDFTNSLKNKLDPKIKIKKFKKNFYGSSNQLDSINLLSKRKYENSFDIRENDSGTKSKYNPPDKNFNDPLNGNEPLSFEMIVKKIIYEKKFNFDLIPEKYKFTCSLFVKKILRKNLEESYDINNYWTDIKNLKLKRNEECWKLTYKKFYKYQLSLPINKKQMTNIKGGQYFKNNDKNLLINIIIFYNLLTTNKVQHDFFIDTILDIVKEKERKKIEKKDGYIKRNQNSKVKCLKDVSKLIRYFIYLDEIAKNNFINFVQKQLKIELIKDTNNKLSGLTEEFETIIENSNLSQEENKKIIFNKINNDKFKIPFTESQVEKSIDKVVEDLTNEKNIKELEEAYKKSTKKHYSSYPNYKNESLADIISQINRNRDSS